MYPILTRFFLHYNGFFYQYKQNKSTIQKDSFYRNVNQSYITISECRLPLLKLIFMTM